MYKTDRLPDIQKRLVVAKGEGLREAWTGSLGRQMQTSTDRMPNNKSCRVSCIAGGCFAVGATRGAQCSGQRTTFSIL